MTDAPERIWLDMREEELERYGRPFVTQGLLASEPRTEYIRSDLVDAAEGEAFARGVSRAQEKARLESVYQVAEVRERIDAAVAAEREACARVVDRYVACDLAAAIRADRYVTCSHIAAEIRARCVKRGE